MPLVTCSVATAIVSQVTEWPCMARIAKVRLLSIISTPEAISARPMPSQAMKGAASAVPTIRPQKPTTLLIAMNSVSEKPSSTIIGLSIACPIASPSL